MKIFVYTALVCAFGAFWLGCAEVEYSEMTEMVDWDNITSDLGKLAESNANLNATKANKSAQKSKASPKLAKSSKSQNSAPKNTAKSTIDSHKSMESTQSKSTPKSANPLVDFQDSSAIQMIDSQDLGTNQAQDLQDLHTNQIQSSKDSRILNQSAPKIKFSFNPAKLNQSLPQLESRCASGDLGYCEDLGRIYAVQEKRDLAVAHYKRACNNGKGKVMSCFFLSLIYANNGDSATSSEYLSVISDKLESHKIDEAELLLSIGEIALIKEKLQNFCANGESSSCKILSSVFKIRSENSEARAFFSAECKRTNNPNAMLCVILKSLQ